MSEQATPRPWRADIHGMVVWGESVGGCRMEKAEHKVADIRGWGHLSYLGEDRAIEIQKANARLIVRSVNCHDELVKALETWLADYDGWSCAELEKRADPATIERIYKSRAALAKAKAHD